MVWWKCLLFEYSESNEIDDRQNSYTIDDQEKNKPDFFSSLSGMSESHSFPSQIPNRYETKDKDKKFPVLDDLGRKDKHFWILEK